MGLNYKEKDFDLDNYVKVNVRLTEFWNQHQEGSIVTESVMNTNGSLTVKASVYRNSSDAKPAATGHAFLDTLKGEKVGEMTETTAVGRALALMGYSVEKSIASAEEMKRFNKAKTAKKEVLQSEPQEVSKLKTTSKFDLSKIRKDTQNSSESK